MNSNKLLIYIVYIFFISNSEIISQETIIASGIDASGTGGSISYSIGQILINQNIGTNGSVSEGVQQTLELLTLGIDEDIELIATAIAYPNPTTNNIKVNLNLNEFNDLSFQLYDLNGKLLNTQKITKNIIIVPMNSLPTAVYFLKIMRLNTQLKEFRILKTN